MKKKLTLFTKQVFNVFYKGMNQQDDRCLNVIRGTFTNQTKHV